MTKLYRSGLVLALGCLGMAVAQAQQTPPPSERTKPGESPTKAMTPAEQQQDPRQQEDPRPATSQTEGTAADNTMPGRTPTGEMARRSEIIGASVVTTSNAPLGKVVDVVFDAAKQPAFVVIESAGKATAVPYSVASSMKTADKIVIDQSRLQAAPKVKSGEWRNESNAGWKKEATKYWDRG